MFHAPYFPDLDVYSGSEPDNRIGLEPLAVGWLRRGKPFPTGQVPNGFAERLLRFCLPQYGVNPWPRPLPCALENHPVGDVLYQGQIVHLGRAEIRVIGEVDVFAAPDLIYHYVVTHHYRPPAEFIEGVLHGPQPTSAEFQALIRALG